MANKKRAQTRRGGGRELLCGDSYGLRQWPQTDASVGEPAGQKNDDLAKDEHILT